MTIDSRGSLRCTLTANEWVVLFQQRSIYRHVTFTLSAAFGGIVWGGPSSLSVNTHAVTVMLQESVDGANWMWKYTHPIQLQPGGQLEIDYRHVYDYVRVVLFSEGPGTVTGSLITPEDYVQPLVVSEDEIVTFEPSFSTLTREVITPVPQGPTARVAETDVVMDVNTSAGNLGEWAISVVDAVDLDPADVVYWSGDPSVLQIDDQGRISWVSNGFAYVYARIGTWEVTVTAWVYVFDYRIDTPFVVVYNTSGDTVYTLVNWVAGSLARHCDDAIDTLIAGKDPLTDWDVFTSQVHIPPAYVRNAACWAQGLDLTGWSVWNTRSNSWKPAAIASDCICLPWHLIEQFGVPCVDCIRVGDTVRFITAGNVVVDRTITALQRILTLDLAVGCLSAALPGTIKPMLLFPANVGAYLPHLADSAFQLRVAVLGGNAYEKALVRDVLYLQYDSTGVYQTETAVEATRALFSENIISGDSGNLCCLVVNGELVYTGGWSTAGGSRAGGPSLHLYLTEIQAAMVAMGCTGALSFVALGGFPTY